jgi:hypothetical protein
MTIGWLLLLVFRTKVELSAVRHLISCFFLVLILYLGAKGVVCAPEGARLADNCVPTKLRKCHLFLLSPIHACPRHGPWATS